MSREEHRRRALAARQIADEYRGEERTHRLLEGIFEAVLALSAPTDEERARMEASGRLRQELRPGERQ